MEDEYSHMNLNNVERVFIAMHDGMMKSYAEASTRSGSGSRRLCSRRINDPFSVEHAERAVEILDVEVRGMVSAEEFPEGDLEEARGLLELAKQRSAAAEEGDKPLAPVEEREGEGEAEDQGESGAVPSMEELRMQCRDARAAVKSLGLREDEVVLELNDRLLDAFSNDESGEPARRQLFAVINELTQYVKKVAALADDGSDSALRAASK
ncbi:hypothetical protein LTR91_017432 [Friedmanniomyces endolithicus]|uniref:Uncharacterized protein n=1 Tax=Friedmanniomyces endolithicus TaxID=329885 RepID=A0AAN6K626_9PEZI|nr:hypothetical protein LTR94_001404 [Friedmanniomyces endolithicus]KAK0776407.1 hypothetical protein LTR59_014216 [Friedmanniomyces endolithicus]KAK0818428.1 hypothetical protein LTR38_001010 [Friedmanniomyces endolithicus]KAK0821193.1 hypothetical protein LTR75_000994 [Friedmanniomyces endolithicus]KAK0834087.1 hypothetical protein LTR03_014629 [Friedmanniomyces endolithicus]